MKRLTLVYFFSCLFSISIYSQIEMKTDIGKLLNREMYLSGEYLINPWRGLDVSIGFENDEDYIRDVNVSVEKAFELKMMVKFYFAPLIGNDRFYFGGYWLFRQLNHMKSETPIIAGNGSFIEKRNAIGIMLGYKWIGDSGLFADFSIGGGLKNYKLIHERMFIKDENSVNPHWLGQIQVGYRFGGK